MKKLTSSYCSLTVICPQVWANGISDNSRLTTLYIGSFVASSGLESYATHGFLTSGRSGLSEKLLSVTEFVRDSLATYARSALPFVSDAHNEVQRHVSETSEQDIATTVRRLLALDELYESTTLNHVARRASRSQGVALLTLYSKGFSTPTLPGTTSEANPKATSALVDQLKLIVRREDTPGHLPICWGVLTGALGLSVGMFYLLVFIGYHENRFVNRKKSIPTSVLACKRSPLRCSSHEHHRTLRVATATVTHHTSTSHIRGSEMCRTSDRTTAASAGGQSGECGRLIRRRGDGRDWSYDDLASRRNSGQST